MFTVELYAKVRHAVMIEGLSRREAAKRFGIHRNTITKMLSFSVPPGYRRRVAGECPSAVRAIPAQNLPYARCHCRSPIEAAAAAATRDVDSLRLPLPCRSSS